MDVKKNGLEFRVLRSISLPSFVDEIVEVKGGSTATRARLYPRNTPEILINLSSPIKGNIGGRVSSVKSITIQGSKTEYANAFHPPGCHFISIRFATNGYYRVLDVSQKRFTDRLFPLDDVVGIDTDEIISRLQRASSSNVRFRILCRWIEKEFKGETHESELLSDCIIKSLNDDYRLSVSQLADDVGFTRKHLVHRFKEETGLTIKEYQKIERLQRVLQHVSTQDEIHWTGIACEYGFYDQSHLIRDFKRYTGCTPTHYLERRELVEA